MGSLYKYRNNYHIGISVNGKRPRINTHLPATKENLSKARKMLRDIENQVESLYNNKNSLAYNNVISSDKNISLIEAIEKCIIERIEGKSATHLRNMNSVMNYFYKIVDTKTPIGEITSADINKVIKLIESNVANATLHTYIRYIKLLFNYLVEEDYLYKTPVKKKLVPKRERNNIVIFDESVLESILEIAKRRDLKFYNCLMLLLLTGLRPIDLLNLKIGDFDFNKNFINIKISKTKKEIKYPLYGELLTFIDNNMKEDFEKDKDCYLFHGFNIEIIGRRFRRIKKLLNIKGDFKTTLKTFRKSFGTLMAEKGLSIQEVSYLLAHDSVKTTEKFYTDVITESLRKKINGLRKEP